MGQSSKTWIKQQQQRNSTNVMKYKVLSISVEH